MKSEYVVVKSEIDSRWRVMKRADAPYGTCYSDAEDIDDSIYSGASFLGIHPSEIEVY